MIQLFNYDIENIYNLRTSLNSIFSLRNDHDIDSTVDTSKLYMNSITSKSQFKSWLADVSNSTYRSSNGSSQLLFMNKTLMLGDTVLIKYDTRETVCKAQVPGNKSCIYVTYSDSTKGRLYMISSD